MLVKAEVACFKLKGEDYHCIHTTQSVGGVVNSVQVSATYSLAAVLDGHGGKKAAEYSAKQIPVVFKNLLQESVQNAVDKLDMEHYNEMLQVSAEQQMEWMMHDAVAIVVPQVLQETFEKVNDDFLSKNVDSGTTATVIVTCGTQLFTANVGDSLAFLDTGACVQQLTSSHRLEDSLSEQERILLAGGELAQAAVDGKAAGPLRVWPGGLAMSRSLGDRHAGDAVSPCPAVSQVTLGAQGARIIMASDGLWDAVSGKAAAHRVRNTTYSKAAAKLRSVGKDQRDQDDITVIVVDLISDPSDRLPAALTETHTSHSQEPHQLWHPLDQNLWTAQWNHIMKARTAMCNPKEESSSDSVFTAASEEASDAVGESDLVKPVVSDPGLLYQEVMSIQDALRGTADDEGEWVTVPSKHTSHTSADVTISSVSTSGRLDEFDHDQEPPRFRDGGSNGRGRGNRGRGGRRGGRLNWQGQSQASGRALTQEGPGRGGRRQRGQREICNAGVALDPSIRSCQQDECHVPHGENQGRGRATEASRRGRRGRRNNAGHLNNGSGDRSEQIHTPRGGIGQEDRGRSAQEGAGRGRRNRRDRRLSVTAEEYAVENTSHQCSKGDILAGTSTSEPHHIEHGSQDSYTRRGGRRAKRGYQGERQSEKCGPRQSFKGPSHVAEAIVQ